MKTMHITERRTEVILRGLIDKYCADYAHAYGEPGYTSPAHPGGIILANWNDVPKRIAQYLEEAGWELEWSDEWTIVDNKAYRTQADSYSWQPTAVCPPTDCEYITPEDGAELAIESFASEHPGEIYSLPYWVTDDDLTEAGFELYADKLESGWYPGQTDDPVKISRQLLREGGPARRVVARVDGVGQFDCRFSIWFAPCNEPNNSEE